MADLTVMAVLKKLGKDILGWVKSNCVNNLVSTATNLPLAANQGKVLDEKIDEINQSLIDTIKCGDTYQKNDVLFNCQDWDDGLYIIYNTRGAGSVCEFLYKNDSFVTMTNIAPQTHTIDGYNITFQTGTWYASLWAHKII